MWETLNQLLSSPNREIILSIATIVSSSILVITLAYNIKSYNNMRMVEQIKLAHDFRKEYRELAKVSADLAAKKIPKSERKDWAADYFDALEWFAYLINTNQIKNLRLIRIFEELIIESYDKILPGYFPNEEERKQENFYPELRDLYRDLKSGKTKSYRHKIRGFTHSPKQKDKISTPDPEANVNSKKHSE